MLGMRLTEGLPGYVTGALIAAACLAIVVLWPLSIRFQVNIDVFGRDLRLWMSTLFGHAVLQTVRNEQGKFDAVLAIYVLHVIPLKTSFAGGVQTGTGGGSDNEADVEMEGANALDLAGYVWDRWRPTVLGVWAGTRFALRQMRVQRLQVCGWVGLGDPARTALFHGLMWTTFGMVGAWLQRANVLRRAPAVALWPVYNRLALRFETEGTVRIRGCDLARAGYAALREYVKRRYGKGKGSGKRFDGIFGDMYNDLCTCPWRNGSAKDF